MGEHSQDDAPIYEELVASTENLDADPNNPGDQVTTHDEDDDPTQHAGEFVEEDNS